MKVKEFWMELEEARLEPRPTKGRAPRADARDDGWSYDEDGDADMPKEGLA